MDRYDAWLLTEAEKQECESCNCRVHYEQIHCLENGDDYRYFCERCYHDWLCIVDEIGDLL